jgi:RNA polymerase sigma-70 factor (ECF subfamily)
MKDIPQETRWVLRAQTGDREALDALLRAVQEPLYRYVLSLMGEPALAEDVLQEVFLRVYRKLRWLRTPELFRPWAYRIASRETFKHLRRERRWTDQVRDEAVLESRPAPPAQLTPEDVTRLPEMVAAVSPASRAVIVLHYLHEMKLDEVAEVLGIGLGTVKSRLAYGLATLRRLLNEPDTATRRFSS